MGGSGVDWSKFLPLDKSARSTAKEAMADSCLVASLLGVSRAVDLNVAGVVFFVVGSGVGDSIARFGVAGDAILDIFVPFVTDDDLSVFLTFGGTAGVDVNAGEGGGCAVLEPSPKFSDSK